MTKHFSVIIEIIAHFLTATGVLLYKELRHTTLFLFIIIYYNCY